MPTSANASQSPISGKYGRVLVASAADPTSLYPVNLTKWAINVKTNNIDTTGFESAGWEEGITEVVGAEITLEGPYQINRTGGLPGAGMQILTAGAWVYYQLFHVHTDYYSAVGSLLRWAGVAQVIGHPTDQECRQRGNLQVTLMSRGPIYRPGVAESLAASAQIALYSTGILS